MTASWMELTEGGLGAKKPQSNPKSRAWDSGDFSGVTTQAAA
jgi:hypothetical protein